MILFNCFVFVVVAFCTKGPCAMVLPRRKFDSAFAILENSKNCKLAKTSNQAKNAAAGTVPEVLKLSQLPQTSDSLREYRVCVALYILHSSLPCPALRISKIRIFFVFFFFLLPPRLSLSPLSLSPLSLSSLSLSPLSLSLSLNTYAFPFYLQEQFRQPS